MLSRSKFIEAQAAILDHYFSLAPAAGREVANGSPRLRRLPCLDDGRSDVVLDAAARRPARDELAALGLDGDVDAGEPGLREPSLDPVRRRRAYHASADQRGICGEL